MTKSIPFLNFSANSCENWIFGSLGLCTIIAELRDLRLLVQREWQKVHMEIYFVTHDEKENMEIREKRPLGDVLPNVAWKYSVFEAPLQHSYLYALIV